jgi:hypothetical protein
VRRESEGGAELTWNDVGSAPIEHMHIEIDRVNWFSTYRVHHRVAGSFRRGRAFLLGDAAHVHSPVGGQGMNTGIGDAVNLAWKLAEVLRNRAPAELLDSYEPERIAFARLLVSTTDRAFTFATRDGFIARNVRMRFVPLILPVLARMRFVRRLLFRTVSQIRVNYRHSSLAEGRAGAVSGGNRLPWVKLDEAGADNFAALASMDWQVHVYGESRADLGQACARRGLRLNVFSWQPHMRTAGLARDASYLVRPDGYVALADAAAHAPSLERWIETRGLHFTTPD